MSPQPIETRVENLETRVTRLEELPARIDDLTSQVVQLRMEMRADFSAVRSEMAILGADLRAEMKAFATREDLEAVSRQMRVLHEDVIARIALLQEALTPPPRRRKSRR